jgi:small subunit ribosomal protein S21
LAGLYGKGVMVCMAHIVVDDSEALERAIKRFKRMVEKEGIIREYKKREYFEKPSTILNRKNKALRRKLMKKTRRTRSEY